MVVNAFHIDSILAKDDRPPGSSCATPHDNHHKENDNPVDILQNILLHYLPPIPPRGDQQLDPNHAIVLPDSSSASASASATISESHSTRGISLWKQIQQLHRDALHQLLPSGEKEDESMISSFQKEYPATDIIIPPIMDDGDLNPAIAIADAGSIGSSSLYTVKKPSCNNRGLFRRQLRLAFPLLKTETLGREHTKLHMPTIAPPPSSCNTTTPNHHPNKTSDHSHLRCITVQKDTTFHALLPYLTWPSTNLVALYTFRNRGCVLSTGGNNGGGGRDSRSGSFRNHRKRRDARKRVQPHNNDHCVESTPTADADHNPSIPMVNTVDGMLHV